MKLSYFVLYKISFYLSIVILNFITIKLKISQFRPTSPLFTALFKKQGVIKRKYLVLKNYLTNHMNNDILKLTNKNALD